MEMEPVTVTVAGAKKALGLGTTKLYEMIGAGELEAVKFGGATRITTASIKALVASAPRLSRAA